MFALELQQPGLLPHATHTPTTWNLCALSHHTCSSTGVFARAQGGHDVFAHELPLPGLPPRAAYAPADAPAHAPRAPLLDNAALAALAPEQSARVRSEHGACASLDEQLWRVRFLQRS